MTDYKIIFDNIAWQIMNILGYRFYIGHWAKEPRLVDSLDELDNLSSEEQGIIEVIPFKSKRSANNFYTHLPKACYENWMKLDDNVARDFQVIGSKVYLHLVY